VRSDYAGDLISFMYYDASEDAILNVVEILIFEPDAMYGNILVPIIFNIGSDCEDNDWDGICDDASFAAAATSADANNDGLVDEFPVLSIVDGNAQVLIESSEGHYVDSGATCSDQEDGPISHGVEVSGDVVNMSVPGMYMISYNCSDSDGNAAQTKHRIVFVLDECLFFDENEEGYDDASYIAGATGGDINLDLVINVADIVSPVNLILSGE